MKGPESSFLEKQECIQHKHRKNQSRSEAEVSETLRVQAEGPG